MAQLAFDMIFERRPADEAMGDEASEFTNCNLVLPNAEKPAEIGGCPWKGCDATYLGRFEVDVPPQHSEVHLLLSGLVSQIGEDIISGIFQSPWLRSQGTHNYSQRYEFIISRDAKREYVRIIDTWNAPTPMEMDSLLPGRIYRRDAVIFTDDAETMFAAFNHHDVLQHDLHAFLEYLLVEGNRASLSCQKHAG